MFVRTFVFIFHHRLTQMKQIQGNYSTTVQYSTAICTYVCMYRKDVRYYSRDYSRHGQCDRQQCIEPSDRVARRSGGKDAGSKDKRRD